MGDKKPERREEAKQLSASSETTAPKPRKKPPRLLPDKLRAKG